MNLRTFLILGILVMVIGIVASRAAFTVNQTNQAIVLQFGEPKRVITRPGLYWKLPFIQNALFYERRVLDLNPSKETIIFSDQKRLLVDALARYRIADPLLFFKTVRTEDGVRSRLGAIVKASMRHALGKVPMASVFSEERSITILVAFHISGPIPSPSIKGIIGFAGTTIFPFSNLIFSPLSGRFILSYAIHYSWI